MAKKSKQEVVRENVELGFDPQLIKIAYDNVKGDADKQIPEQPQKPSSANDEDAQLSKAIQMSINEAKDKKISLEPLNPEQRIRKAGIPVGLKNIGNTCYFNSLLQTYFQNVEFVRSVLNYNTPDKYKKDKKASAGQQQIQFKRKQASCRLVQNLKTLFASMIASDRKYLDPTEVIGSIVDDYGNQIPIGDQKDIGQFNLIFLSRIDEGLSLGKKQNNEMQLAEGEPKIDSPSKIAVFGEEHESRLSHRSSIKIQQNSLINQQFIGTMLNSYNNQAHNIHQSQQQQFSLLFVNVKNKQLYQAIQAITIQHIDDYRNQKGEVVGVQKQSWIEKAPKTLFFQIDRVVFEKQIGQLKKINDEFSFPQTFYIDPFLLENKDRALAVQKQVKKLRDQRQKYTNALKSLQKFGQKNLNLIDMINSTISFLNHQSQKVQSQDQALNPIIFSHLAPKLKPQIISTLKQYEQSVSKRIQNFERKIKSIQEQIEKIYSSMRSTPYYLYSILIHEGSADSGHYYSYTYDIQSKTWRKYNDINITEQVQAQVLRQARGVNFTSAYYLVYSQDCSLVPADIGQKMLRNFQISNCDKYLKDYFSSMIPVDIKNKIGKQNQQLYLQIEQYKMSGFANRVIDNYAKKFQTCNQNFRKSKWQKKKNGPPLLTNLPLYLKSLNLQQAYKGALIANSMNQYGPKQENPVFVDLLKKKATNFNDFKKPKNFNFDQKHAQVFINSVYKTKAATKIFQSLKNQQYRGTFGLLRQLKSGQSDQFFEWFYKLISKILMVTFLAQSEMYLQKKQLDQVMQRLRLMLVLGLNFINREQQKALINNCMYWATQISVNLPQDLKAEVEKIVQRLNKQGKQSQYDQIIDSQSSKNQINEIRNSTEIQDALWNISRSQNVFIDSYLAAREGVKGKMQAANLIYKQMKNKNIPLSKAQRQNIIIKNSNK